MSLACLPTTSFAVMHRGRSNHKHLISSVGNGAVASVVVYEVRTED